jgi:hypothetical protein
VEHRFSAFWVEQRFSAFWVEQRFSAALKALYKIQAPHGRQVLTRIKNEFFTSGSGRALALAQGSTQAKKHLSNTL